MRQNKALAVMLAAAAAVLVALAVYGFVRAGQGGAAPAHEHGEEPAAAEPHEHAEEPTPARAREPAAEREQPAAATQEQPAERELEAALHEHEEAEEHEHTAEAGAAPSGTLSGGVRTVAVLARRFEFVPSPIVVREGEQVRLKITSEDVAHGFLLKEYDIQERLDPGQEAQVSFRAGEPGRHPYRCWIYCGEGHDRMQGELVVLEADH